MILDRQTPYELSDGVVTPGEAKALQRITIRWSVGGRRNHRYNAHCTREIIDSVRTFHRVDEQAIEDAFIPTAPFTATSVVVPQAATWGPASYRSTCCYELEGTVTLTSLFPVCRRWPEVRFVISPTVAIDR
jgi:hypothetical protein